MFSRYVEFEGEDHFPWVGDSEAALAAIEEFLTGVRPGPAPERVLATVLFTDIVDSTRLAAELGDRRWRELLASRTVRDLAAGSGVVFDPAGTHALKGIADEWEVYSVA